MICQFVVVVAVVIVVVVVVVLSYSKGIDYCYCCCYCYHHYYTAITTTTTSYYDHLRVARPAGAIVVELAVSDLALAVRVAHLDEIDVGAGHVVEARQHRVGVPVEDAYSVCTQV